MGNQKVEYRIDLTALHSMARTGPLRASAFLATGLSVRNNPTLKTLSLAEESAWRFWPDPLPEEVFDEVLGEYEIWIAGNAFRELDMNLHLFLDEVWKHLEMLRFQKKAPPKATDLTSVEAETNAANKYSKVVKAMQLEDKYRPLISSLSRVRNCLTHHGGRVKQRHVADDGLLKPCWLGLETRLDDGENQTVLNLVGGTPIGPLQKPATVLVKILEKTAEFKVGDQVEFTPTQLHEICFFYLHLAEHILIHHTKWLKQNGVSESETPTS